LNTDLEAAVTLEEVGGGEHEEAAGGYGGHSKL